MKNIIKSMSRFGMFLFFAIILASSSAFASQKNDQEFLASQWFELGNKKYDQKDYREAKENYEKAIALRPQYAEAYYNLGLTYGHMGDYQKAIECYRKAISIKPQYANAYYNRAVAYEKLHMYTEAKWDYAKAYELNPTNEAMTKGKKRSENW